MSASFTKRSLACLTTAIIGSLAGVSACWSQPTETQQANPVAPIKSINPVDEYKEAWRIVKENFYDETYNGQDWNRWENKFDGQLKDLDDAYLAISTMLASLGDNRSIFLSKDRFCEEKAQIAERFFGVGITIGLNPEGRMEIKAPIPRTPAYHAGVETGDIIVAVDHKPAPRSTADAVSLIRGRRHTPVTLTIERDHNRRDFTIYRDDIPVYCVFDSRMLDDEIGYIRIDTLYDRIAVDDVIENLSSLTSLKGLIIDLRGNPGGQLLNAFDVATLFLENGVIAYQVGQAQKQTETYKVDERRVRQSDVGNGVKKPLPLFKQPLVILIDGSTNGNAEVVVGALKGNRRAELVGEKTYGGGKIWFANPDTIIESRHRRRQM